MYKCKPERNTYQAMLIVVICVLVTSLTFLLGSVSTQYGGVIKFLGLAFLVTSILLVVRYTLTEMEYTVDGGDFTVTKIVGNRRTDICCISLETVTALIGKREYDHLPRDKKAIIRYSLNQNMKADSYVCMCVFNGKTAMVEFEPNPAFVSIMKSAIADAKKDTDSGTP